jgi:dipeptidyl aminopeptidase/acylaminoacyl peptidase
LLIVPKVGPPWPAAVIIQGSGKSDRRNTWAATIAFELARNGLAVLLTDKRGSGVSGGDWRTVGFETLADDALAAVAFLRSRADVDGKRIGLVGLSQGGSIAPIAAARSQDVAYVVNVSGGAVGFAEKSFVEMANTARQAKLSDDMVRLVVELNRAAMRYVLVDDWPTYARLRERGLGTPARQIVAGFPSSAGDPLWTGFRKLANFDPLSFWAAVSQPVLTVHGELDEYDNVPVTESVRRLDHVFRVTHKHNFQTIVLSGLGHSLMDERHSMERFNEVLRRWLREHVVR